MRAAVNSHNGAPAFTLVEVLACLVFLGILLPAVISALLIANRAGVASERAEIAVQLGQNKLAEWMIDNEWSSASGRGDFGAEFPNYRYELAKADWGNNAMTELSLDVFYSVQGQEHHVRLATLVSETISQARQQEAQQQ